jgi:hypothetical protein
MNKSGDRAAQARGWIAYLLPNTGPAAAAAPVRPPAAPALAALVAEALARDRSLLLITPDDAPLADLSNAIDLDLRPLCLVLPAADYAFRIALRATLSLLRSRLARAGSDASGPAWQTQRQRLIERTALWQQCLAWNERGVDGEAWPRRVTDLFPVRVLPLSLALELRATAEWTVITDTARLPDPVCRPWPDALRTLLLEYVGGASERGALAASDPASRRQAEIDVLTQELSDLELELATAQAEIADFTRRYHALVGARMATLDELQASLTAHRAANAPTDTEAARMADAARQRAERSRAESRCFSELDLSRVKPFAPGQDIKKLYRRIAQRIHPDRATDEADRVWRTQLMAEANRAYQAGDDDALREVLSTWQEGAGRATTASATTSTRTSTSGLDILEALIARLKRRIGEIEAELKRLFGSKLYELFTAANIAHRAGRDLVQEMATRLDSDIATVQAELDALD